MHAVEALALAPVGAGLGAEAVRDPRELLGKLGLVEDLVGVEAAEGDLGGSDQAEVRVGDRVDLGLGPSWIEADSGEDFRFGEVRGGVGDEAVREQQVEREALEAEFEEHRFVFEKVELGPGDAGTALEIDEVEPCPDLDVVERRKIEGRDRAHTAELA